MLCYRKNSNNMGCCLMCSPEGTVHSHFSLGTKGRPPNPSTPPNVCVGCLPNNSCPYDTKQAVLTAGELNEQFKEILLLHADLITITTDQKDFHKWAVPKILQLEKRIKVLEAHVSTLEATK